MPQRRQESLRAEARRRSVTVDRVRVERGRRRGLTPQQARGKAPPGMRITDLIRTGRIGRRSGALRPARQPESRPQVPPVSEWAAVKYRTRSRRYTDDTWALITTHDSAKYFTWYTLEEWDDLLHTIEDFDIDVEEYGE